LGGGRPYICVGTINFVSLSYDLTKSERNEALRGLPFSLAEHFDWTTALVVEDTRKDYAERRYQALGLIDGQLHMLVFTPRRGTVHVISLRRANRRERTRHAAQDDKS
jgi:uncharacterized DUF497 family protein